MKKRIFILCLLISCSLSASESVNTLKKHVHKALPRIEGWCSNEKADSIIDIILQENPNVCVEIGVFGGSSILPTGSALKHIGQGLVYAIDPWETAECTVNYDPVDDKANYSWWDTVNLGAIYKSYLKMLKRHHIENYCCTLKMTSLDAAEYIDVIDILHIDGNHSEESSTLDVMTFLPKVRSGGYIWMDDLHWGTTGAAVELLKQECELIKLVDDGNCALFRKF